MGDVPPTEVHANQTSKAVAASTMALRSVSPCWLRALDGCTAPTLIATTQVEATTLTS